MTTKPLCWVPYYTAELTHVTTKPYCKFNFSDTMPYPDIRDFNSAEAQAWREESFMGTELKDQCRACKVPDSVYSYERMNRRTFQLDGWRAPERAELRKLIIGMDNICASSCIQCGPHFSHTLGRLAASQPPQVREKVGVGSVGTQQVDLDKLDGQLAHLEILHLFGGEPLFSPNLVDLIKMCQEQAPRLRRISLSTGLTRIKESHVSLLNDLNIEIQLNVSLDGPMELNSWIRGITPEEFTSSWNMIDSYPNVRISGFQTTIGAYNVFALPEYLEFLHAIWPTTRAARLHGQVRPGLMSTLILSPSQLSPRQLPPEFKKQIKPKLISARQTNPGWAKELFSTAIFNLDLPSTHDWDVCLNRLNAYPAWRGETTSWEDMWHKYMG